MTNPYKNKKVIWESKTKQIFLTFISFLFVAAAIGLYDEISSLLFWGTMILFGGGGLVLLVSLLNPKNLFVTPKSELGKEIRADQFRKHQEDFGLFSYDDTGFNLIGIEDTTHYKWTDIETVFGFKEDRITTDDICLEVFTSDSNFIKLTEDTPGWNQFSKRLLQHIPSIPKSWEEEITLPPFETKLTLLYDKKGRTLKEAEEEYYSN